MRARETGPANDEGIRDGWIGRMRGQWCVLHTRARCEKAVASCLEQQGVCHYLPLVAVHHTYARWKPTFRIPLFPGYVFMCAEPADWEKAWRTRRVVRIIEVVHQDRLRAELAQVQRVVESNRAVELFPAIRVGQRCRVTSGALRGIEGVVIQNGRCWKIYLAVTTLGQSAVVEVDAARLEAVG